ncbi:dihydropteroate synthase [Aquabacter cavernae]|uniref:dihydropteroate synthase n=1 Tax=Aquabacter cavernae TaxID=2496029 RepID=UPI000F8F342B|nr:dihydropteroate synthase [Aquabacter cavernae]
MSLAPFTPPPARLLKARGHVLTLGPRTLVMGVLNVTPDSFSDGGRSAAPEDALANAQAMIAEGADILDVGGESTRPGHTPLSADEEWARIAPVLSGLAALETAPPVSVDTFKAEVARRALAAGAAIVNDIWGFARDPDMARATADFDAAAVVMHNRETLDPAIDIVADMIAFFERALERAAAAGLAAERIVLDPGIGFGKTPEQNLTALRRMGELRVLGLPILLGTSRKSFIGRIHPSTPTERLPGTLASHALGILCGAEIVRAHDVAAHVQAVRVLDAIRAAP